MSKNVTRKPIFILVEAAFKKDIERLAAAKSMTLSSLIRSASMEYLRREIGRKETLPLDRN